MGDLTLFEKGKWKIRYTVIDDAPWFVAKDICDNLDIAWNGATTLSRIPKAWQGVSKFNTPGGTQEYITINQAGVSKLAFRSHKQEAEEFTDWVAGDVVPSIMKHGMYATPATVDAMLADPDNAIRMLTAYKEERAARLRAEEQLQIEAPKVEGYDALMSSKDSMPIGEFAKVLGWGQNRAFRWLREQRILMTDPWNIPYQNHIDAGHFRVIEEPWGPEEDRRIYRKTLVTPAGQDYILKRKKAAAI
jgi:anti-repressor protein